jgi:hypothetical protein
MKTEEYYLGQIKDFYNRTGNWPRAQEIPTLSRGIQRKYGGLVAFRKKHGLGYEDYTKGEYRSKVTKEFNKRGREGEDKLALFLEEKFGKVNVHRNFYMYDDYRFQADFGVYLPNNNFIIIDCFHAKDVITMQGCINIKSRKYKKYTQHPVYFVQINKNISTEELNSYILSKRTPLQPNQTVISFEDFKKLDFVV